MTSFSSALCPPPPRPPNAAPERPDMEGILCNRECGEGSVGRGVKEEWHCPRHPACPLHLRPDQGCHRPPPPPHYNHPPAVGPGEAGCLGASRHPACPQRRRPGRGRPRPHHTITTHLQLIQARQGAWRPPGTQHAPSATDQTRDAPSPAADAEAASGLRRLAHHASGDARAAGTRRQSRLTLREGRGERGVGGVGGGWGQGEGR